MVFNQLWGGILQQELIEGKYIKMHSGNICMNKEGNYPETNENYSCISNSFFPHSFKGHNPCQDHAYEG